MPFERLQQVEFLSKATEQSLEENLCPEIKRQQEALSQEMTTLASKPGELNGRETIRFKYAKHRLDAVVKSEITISAET